MTSPAKPASITFLGCGKLGSAMLDGLLLASTAPDASSQLQITSLTACVQRQSSHDALVQKYAAHAPLVSVLVNNNLAGAQRADIVILGCKPPQYASFLAEPGLRDALAHKILINTLVGVSAAQIRSALDGPPGPSPGDTTAGECSSSSTTTIINAIPNTAAAVRQSLTFICDPPSCSTSTSTSTPSAAMETATALLSLLGPTRPVPATATHLMPVYATIGAAAAAFYSAAVEGVVRESEAQGVAPADALAIAAAVLRGTAALMTAGHTLPAIRARIATPGGTTERGLRVLEDKAVAPAMAEAVRRSTETAARAGRVEQWSRGNE